MHLQMQISRYLHLPLHLQKESQESRWLTPAVRSKPRQDQGSYARTSLVNEAAPLNTGLAKQGCEVPAVRREQVPRNYLRTALV